MRGERKKTSLLHPYHLTAYEGWDQLSGAPESWGWLNHGPATRASSTRAAQFYMRKAYFQSAAAGEGWASSGQPLNIYMVPVAAEGFDMAFGGNMGHRYRQTPVAARPWAQTRPSEAAQSLSGSVGYSHQAVPYHPQVYSLCFSVSPISLPHTCTL